MYSVQCFERDSYIIVLNLFGSLAKRHALFGRCNLALLDRTATRIRTWPGPGCRSPALLIRMIRKTLGA